MNNNCIVKAGLTESYTQENISPMRRTHSTNLLDNKKSCAFFFLREIFGYIASGFPVYSSIAPFKLSVYNRLNFFKNTSLVMLWHPVTTHCIEIDTISTKIEEKTHFRNTTGSVTKLTSCSCFQSTLI